jgi:transcriptional repressor of cell division inhibition gene dicB
MKKSDVLKFFKTSKKICEVLNMKSSGAVSQWGDLIPEKRAMQLDRITGGQLRYDECLYQQSSSSHQESA